MAFFVANSLDPRCKQSSAAPRRNFTFRALHKAAERAPLSSNISITMPDGATVQIAGSLAPVDVPPTGPLSTVLKPRPAQKPRYPGDPAASSNDNDPFPYVPGFASYVISEALAGALPDGQNSPQVAPYGLYAEQLSGTAFTVGRHENLRRCVSLWSWALRMLTPAQLAVPHSPVGLPGLVPPVQVPRFGAAVAAAAHLRVWRVGERHRHARAAAFRAVPGPRCRRARLCRGSPHHLRYRICDGQERCCDPHLRLRKGHGQEGPLLRGR